MRVVLLHPDGGRDEVRLPPSAGLATVDALARLRLAALRTAGDVRVHEASPELVELLRLAGLDELLAD